jgi:periplasmic divalent cation tolerance protein
MMKDILTVFVTTANEEETLLIANTVVTERLAACANIVAGIRSIYRWKGEICDSEERLMIIKTRSALFPALEKRIRQLHSYEVPEIVAYPIVAGNADYLQWVFDCTREETAP